MGSIDAKLVGELRKRTGLPMMKCKGALVEAEGNLELAAENLRKLGLKTAEKVAGRTLKDGLVFLDANDEQTAAVAVLCETDFVANSEDFRTFGRALLQAVASGVAGESGEGEALNDMQLSTGSTARAALEDLIARIRENIALGPYACFKPNGGSVSHYLHHDSKKALLVQLDGEGLRGNAAAETLGKDLAMHLTFHSATKALSRDDLDQDWVAKEREIFEAQVQDQPEERREAIAKGKLNKRLREVVLLEQPFVRDEKQSVQQRIEAVAKEIGSDLKVRRYARIAAKE